MQHLRKYGLTINVTKTVLLIRVAEAETRAILNKHLSKTSRGTYFCLPGLRPEYIPVRDSHVYLGCVISLQDYEALTFKHRLQVGKAQYQRLRHILTNARALPLKRRVVLWQTCIWSHFIWAGLQWDLWCQRESSDGCYCHAASQYCETPQTCDESFKCRAFQPIGDTQPTSASH